ncbi:hypothetical protein AAFN85_13660 [Mucilaginibacter sp. CAU 1740]|uniref:hypothetical protein n=1 Tax=Mucilaginibacter sp. CAU 1740 TaxID=3140365 RepID=UPI00325A881E
MKTNPALTITHIRASLRIALLLLLILGRTAASAAVQATDEQLAAANKRIDILVKDTTRLWQAQKKIAADYKNLKARMDSLTNASANLLNATYRSTFTTGNWFVFIIGTILVIALIVIVFTTPKDGKFPLGLPDGSIRAIIAILAILLYVLISLVLAAIPSSAIASDVTKTLGTLVVAISAFYFGSKTAEQGIKAGADINVAAAKVASESNNCTEPPPLNIIKQAIEANKTEWLKLYNAQDIFAGKKQSSGTINDVDCIIFKVIAKLDSPEGKAIPPLITYATAGKTYKIPTDVQQA